MDGASEFGPIGLNPSKAAPRTLIVDDETIVQKTDSGGPTRWFSVPRGTALTDPVWEQRHVWVTSALLLHFPLLVAWAGFRHTPPLQYLLLLMPVALWSIARVDLLTGQRIQLSRSIASAAAAAGLMSCASFLVDVSGGYIEAHFHFFVLIPVVALYEAWVPFAVAITVVLIEHGLVGTLAPVAVFGHSMMHMEHPWRFAAIHAGFVSLASIGSLVTWRLAEHAREQQQLLIEELHFRAHHDSLTGLANREALGQFLVDCLGNNREAPVSALLMDLNRFKEINDTLGHEAGDELLSMIAQDLQAGLSGVPEALVARLGGDEFAVVLPGRDADSSRTLAYHLADIVSQTYEVAGVEVSVGISIGVAQAQGRSADAGPDAARAAAKELMRHADVAMYLAKARGDVTAAYDPATDVHAQERLNTLNDLRAALNTDDQIVLFYQPKISMSDGSLAGVEALARWNHPTRGLLGPGEFVDLAQSTQHAEDFTRCVLNTALRQVASWLLEGWQVPVAINVTPRCLLRPVFLPALVEALDRYQVPAHLLRLEITEDAIVGDPEAATSILKDLHALGVGLSIDDFGTGFSSLSYLRHLPVDEVKIDRSFITGLGSSRHSTPGTPRDTDDARPDAVLVAAIIDLAHRLGMSVVAEGVEEVCESATLASLGCDIVQGFLFSRPVPPEQLDSELLSNTVLRKRSLLQNDQLS